MELLELYTHCSAIVLLKHCLVQVGEQLLLNVKQHLLVKQKGSKVNAAQKETTKS